MTHPHLLNWKSAGIALLTLCLSAPMQAATKEESFPLIFFAVPDRDDAFANVKQWGGTHVHSYVAGLAAEKDVAFFDRAQAHGLKVMANLNGQKRINAKMGPDQLKEYTDQLNAHPALGIWYLYDEPANHHSAAEVQPLYDLLKNETPNIPVAIALNWTEDSGDFTSIQDMVLNDFYPVTGEPFPRAGLHTITNFTSEVMRSYQQVLPILQIMNWQSLATPEEKELRGFPVSALRYPNATEMRYMSFSSIAMGAKGLGFYSYSRSMMTDPKWAATTLPPVLKEVSEFAAHVAGGKFHRILRAEDDESCLGVWETDGAHWIVFVNSWPAPRKIIRSIRQHVEEGKLIPWGQTREASASLEKGVLSAEFEPWEVMIWKVER